MPHTPGLGDLPGVEQEIPVLVARFPRVPHILRGTAATRAHPETLPDHDIVTGNQLSAITAFDNAVFDRFGLPRILAD